jgi:hypothetical protein
MAPGIIGTRGAAWRGRTAVEPTVRWGAAAPPATASLDQLIV